MTSPGSGIDLLRSFNRLYTARMGLLRREYLGGAFSLTEARLLYEIGLAPGVRASTLCGLLQLDPGYLSRSLSLLGRRGLLKQTASKTDGRQKLLSLTQAGKKQVAELDRRSSEQVEAFLQTISAGDRAGFVDAIAQAHAAMSRETGSRDAGARNAGFRDAGFREAGSREAGEEGSTHPAGGAEAKTPPQLRVEKLASVGEDALQLLEEYYDAVQVVLRDKPKKIRRIVADPDSGLWLASMGGAAVGCVMLRPLEKMRGAAECKRLFVRPAARGHGAASALMEALEAFARKAGYRSIYLDSYEDLEPAIRLYRSRGYEPCKRYNSNPQATVFFRKRL